MHCVLFILGASQILIAPSTSPGHIPSQDCTPATPPSPPSRPPQRLPSPPTQRQLNARRTRHHLLARAPAPRCRDHTPRTLIRCRTLARHRTHPPTRRIPPPHHYGPVPHHARTPRSHLTWACHRCQSCHHHHPRRRECCGVQFVFKC